jgi:Tfp pilus assembly PilM family ATPase
MRSYRNVKYIWLGFLGMNSIGLTVNDNRVVMVSLNKGLRGDPSLVNYRLVSLEEVTPEDREEIILSNVEGFIDQTKSDRDNLFLGIPGSKVIFKKLSLPSPTEENLKEVLGFEMDRYTPFALEDVYFDFNIVKRDEVRDIIHVLLMAIKKDVVDYYLKLFQRINIKVRSIEVVSTAVYNATSKERQPAQNRAAQDWVIKGSAWLKTRSWGGKLAPSLDRFINTGEGETTTGNHATRFFVTLDTDGCELGVVQDNAFTHSRSFTLSPRADGAAPGEGIEELADTVLAELETTRLSLGDDTSIPLQLIVSGSRADMSLVDYVKEKKNTDARLMDTLNIPIDSADAREKIPALSAAVGLALKGLNGVPLDVNFIPRELRPKKKKNWSLILGVSFIVLLLLVLSSYTISFFVKERFYLAELTGRVNALKGTVSKIEQMQEDIAEIEKTINSVEKIKVDATSKLDLLKELTEIIPEEMWLTRFSYSEKKGEREIDLSGFANAASEIIPILEESKFFEDVKFKSSIVKDKSTDKEKFNLKATVSKTNTEARSQESEVSSKKSKGRRQ